MHSRLQRWRPVRQLRGACRSPTPRKAMLACTSEYVLYWMVRSVTMNFLSVLLSCCASDNAGPNSADKAT